MMEQPAEDYTDEEDDEPEKKKEKKAKKEKKKKKGTPRFKNFRKKLKLLYASKIFRNLCVCIRQALTCFFQTKTRTRKVRRKRRRKTAHEVTTDLAVETVKAMIEVVIMTTDETMIRGTAPKIDPGIIHPVTEGIMTTAVITTIVGITMTVETMMNVGIDEIETDDDLILEKDAIPEIDEDQTPKISETEVDLGTENAAERLMT